MAADTAVAIKNFDFFVTLSSSSVFVLVSSGSLLADLLGCSFFVMNFDLFDS